MSKSSPSFAWLLKLSFAASGIEYISPDHLRKCKTNKLSKLEERRMWKALFDLVNMVLLDFDYDVNVLRVENAEDKLSVAIENDQEHTYRQEIVRYYMYRWGFACEGFYNQDASSSDHLVLAFGWLLATSDFFSHQQSNIIRYMGHSDEPLPPYTTDIVVPSEVQRALAQAATNSIKMPSNLPTLTTTEQVHLLQSTFGHLQHQLNHLYTLQRQHKMLQQSYTSFLSDKEALPLFLQQQVGSFDVDRHQRLLEQLIEHRREEKVFYKWINSVLLSHTPTAPSTQEKWNEDPRYIHLEKQRSKVKDLISRSEVSKELDKGKVEKALSHLQQKIGLHLHRLFLLPKDRRYLSIQPKAIQRQQEEFVGEKLRHELQQVIEEITKEYAQVELCP